MIKIFLIFVLCLLEVTSSDKDINNSNQYESSCALVFGTCMLSIDLTIFHFFFCLHLSEYLSDSLPILQLLLHVT